MSEGIIKYEVNNEEVKLNPAMVRKYLVSGNGNVTDQEVVMFMQLCRYQKLNPFLNEAYLVKFGEQPASIIAGKEAFMKRAENNAHYKGFKAGIVVARGDEMKHLEGALKMPKDVLIGGWADVNRDDRPEPIHVEIQFEEFAKYKFNYKTKQMELQATWKQMPMNMIRKTALVNALREAFPESLGAMYTEDDKQPARYVDAEETDNQPEDNGQKVSDLISPKPAEKPVKKPVDVVKDKPQKSEEPTEKATEQSTEKQADVKELIKDMKANNGSQASETKEVNDDDSNKQESLFESLNSKEVQPESK